MTTDTSAEKVGRYVTEARAIGRAHYADMFLALQARAEAAEAARDTLLSRAAQAALPAIAAAIRARGDA